MFRQFLCPSTGVFHCTHSRIRTERGKYHSIIISQINFWNKTPHVSDSFSVHHQEFFTVHTEMVNIIQVWWQLASRIRTERPDLARKLSPNLNDIHHFCVYSEKFLMMDRETVRNMSSFIPKTFRPDPARKLSPNLNDIYHFCVYSEKFLMMDRETVRNMSSFIPKINLRN